MDRVVGGCAAQRVACYGGCDCVLWLAGDQESPLVIRQLCMSDLRMALAASRAGSSC